MAKKTLEDIASRVETLKHQTRSLGEDASAEARRKLGKALRRAQRRARSIKAEAARAKKAGADG